MNRWSTYINPLNPKLNPICHLLALLGAHHIIHVSRVRVNNCPTRCNTKQSIYYSASSLYMFRVSTTPIVKSTQNCNYSLRYYAPTSLQCGKSRPHWRKVAGQKIWPVTEAVVTVLCTNDDGCGWHPKHVEWNCRIINRMLCVASRWTIINIAISIVKPTRRTNVSNLFYFGMTLDTLVHIVGFTIEKNITLHGPMNIKPENALG